MNKGSHGSLGNRTLAKVVGTTHHTDICPLPLHMQVESGHVSNLSPTYPMASSRQPKPIQGT